MRSLILLLALTLGAPSFGAEVYRHVDENGNVTYSDEPRKGAEKIKIREIPTITMPKGPLTEDALERSQKEKRQPQTSASGYERLYFTNPEDTSAFWSGSGNITLTVEAKPSLRNNHHFEVLLDGKALSHNQSGIFTVQHMDRGTHTATVRIVRDNGGVVETGQSITFTLHRPSALN